MVKGDLNTLALTNLEVKKLIDEFCKLKNSGKFLKNSLTDICRNVSIYQEVITSKRHHKIKNGKNIKDLVQDLGEKMMLELFLVLRIMIKSLNFNGRHVLKNTKLLIHNKIVSFLEKIYMLKTKKVLRTNFLSVKSFYF